MHNMFDLRPPPAGNEYVVVGNGTVLPVIAVGSLKLKFHMPSTYYAPPSDFCVQLTDVYVLEGIPFNLFSLHHVQKKQNILLSASGVHLFDGKLRFDRNERSSLQRATRLSPEYVHCPIAAPAVAANVPPAPTNGADKSSPPVECVPHALNNSTVTAPSGVMHHCQQATLPFHPWPCLAYHPGTAKQDSHRLGQTSKHSLILPYTNVEA